MTARPQHTPGPWKAAEADPLIILGANGLIADLDPEGLSACPSTDEALANARLIAAAPDLLAACEWMIDQLPEPIHDGRDGGPESDWARRYSDARAACCKARGTE